MQMKEKKTSVFEIESIPKAVAVLAIPSVLSMLVTVLYNMVDTVFVGCLLYTSPSPRDCS